MCWAVDGELLHQGDLITGCRRGLRGTVSVDRQMMLKSKYNWGFRGTRSTVERMNRTAVLQVKGIGIQRCEFRKGVITYMGVWCNGYHARLASLECLRAVPGSIPGMSTFSHSSSRQRLFRIQVPTNIALSMRKAYVFPFWPRCCPQRV
jgi:hypothetical protein